MYFLFLLLFLLVFVIGCEKEDIKQDLEVPEEPEKFQKQSSYTKKYVHGAVENPELPDIPKPDDMLYCEKDEDCNIMTDLFLDTCCFACDIPLNKEGKKYIEEWHFLNCNDPGATDECPIIECLGTSQVECIKNKCTSIFE